MSQPSPDAVVVGGGLGGLLTAALLSRRGLQVTVLEAAGRLGGRGATSVRDGYHRNLGAHALYAGVARRTLADLGVGLSGGAPPIHRAKLLVDGRVLPLRVLLPDAAALLRSSVELARIDPAAVADLTVAEWLEEAVPPRARTLLGAAARVTTYQAAEQEASADVALTQIRLGLRGVRYLDGGWQPLSEALASRIVRAGGAILQGVRAERVTPDRHGGAEVSCADGSVHRAPVVVLAAGGPPTVAALLTGDGADAAAAWARRARPIGVTVMDISLDRPLPQPILFGMDRLVYVTEQSRVSRIAPAGAALVSTLRYHDGQPRSRERTAAHVAEIEDSLDRFAPGWRARVVDRHVLPDLTVSWWLPRPASGGLAGRPGPAVPGTAGVYVVGDWVGPRGYLLDAVAASATSVAADVARRGPRRAAPRVAA